MSALVRLQTRGRTNEDWPDGLYHDAHTKVIAIFINKISQKYCQIYNSNKLENVSFLIKKFFFDNIFATIKVHFARELRATKQLALFAIVPKNIKFFLHIYLFL